MSAQLLGARWLRRATRITGLEAIRGWSHGGYWLGFVTAEHVHYIVHTSSHEWELSRCSVYGSCVDRWGASREPEPAGLLVAMLLQELARRRSSAAGRLWTRRPRGVAGTSPSGSPRAARVGWPA